MFKLRLFKNKVFASNSAKLSSGSSDINGGMYLDHAAATPISTSVLNKMHEAEGDFYNPSAIYRSGVMVSRSIQGAREVIANELNSKAGEIYFTGSATESINIAIRGVVYGYYNLKSSEHTNDMQSKVKPNIITSRLEHPAVLETLKDLEKSGHIEIIYLENDSTGKVNTIHLSNVINANTLMVSVTHVNNEIGVVQNMKEIGRVVYLYNLNNNKLNTNSRVLLHIDACQSLNYFKLDSRALRADIISLNSAKIYGPKGIGILMKRQDIRLMPTITGGGQEVGLRSGTEDVVKIVGAAQAVLEASNQREGEVERLRKIQSKIFEELLSNEMYKLIKIVGPGVEYRSPNNLNLIVDGFPSDEMVIRLDYAGYQVSHKSACASDSEEGSYVLEALGYSKREANNNIRITMGRSTTEESMLALLEVIKDIYYKYKI